MEVGQARGVRLVFVIWLGLIVFSVFTGWLNVALELNGLSFSIGGLPVSVSIYPSFVVAVLLAIWLGPAWGIVPLYLANFVSGLASEMSVPVSALFALAGPVEIAILWGSMVLLNVHPGLITWRDRMLFWTLGLVAPTAASLATPLWNNAHELDLLAGQQVWRGWVIGDFLQLVIVAAPVLYYGRRHVQKWLQDKLGTAPQPAPSFATAVPVVVSVFMMLGALTFFGVGNLVATLGISPEARTPAGDLLMPRLIEILVFLGVLFVVLLITTVLFTSALVRRGENERRVAQRDGLTGCFNRRAFKEFFMAESVRNARLALPLSVMMLDADDFKAVNDQHGHEVGDRVLKHLAERIQGVIRETDYLCRWGGEEFVLLLPHTDPDHARSLAERIRFEMEEEPLLDRDSTGPIRVTVSIGVAGRTSPPFEEQALLLMADEALYRAKRLGRNRVEASEPESP